MTDAAQDTASYSSSQRPVPAGQVDGVVLGRLPAGRLSKRGEITASPLRATLDDLAGLPEAFVVVDENDVLRDEGEEYARPLIEAGVRTTTVRYNATIHDFMMLNPLREPAAHGCRRAGRAILRKALGTKSSMIAPSGEERSRLTTTTAR